MKEASVRSVRRSSPKLTTEVNKLKIDPVKDFSEDSFDWEVNLTDSDNHDHEGKLLTSLVRRSYIRHLHKSLVRNYNIWIENYGGGVELSESFIARCASELEKKAVRASMLASLYQHYIIALVKNIKKSTNDNKLYEDLLTSFNAPPQRCDKYVQTNSPVQAAETDKVNLPTAADSTLPPADKRIPQVPSANNKPTKQLKTDNNSTLTKTDKIIHNDVKVPDDGERKLLPAVADSTLTPVKSSLPVDSNTNTTPPTRLLKTDADSTLVKLEQVTPVAVNVQRNLNDTLLPADSTLTLADLTSSARLSDVATVDTPSERLPIRPQAFESSVESLKEVDSDSILTPAKPLLPSVVDSTLANVHSTVDTSFLNVAIDSHILDTLVQSYTEPPKPVPSPYLNESNSSTTKFFVSYLPKQVSGENRKSRLSNASESSAEVTSSKIYDPEVDLSEDRVPLEQNVGSKRKIDSKAQNNKTKRRKSLLEQPAHQKSFEDRLKKFEEIFGDTCEDIPSEPKPPDKTKTKTVETCLASKFFSIVSWKEESIAQTCELNRRLQAVPPLKLRTLRTNFKQLFGPIDLVTDITPQDFIQCRKRVAHMIVFSLTPYFEFGQIGSKQVFKALAREITRIILNDTYAADLEYTQKMVDEVFETGMRYKTLEDVNLLCNR